MSAAIMIDNRLDMRYMKTHTRETRMKSAFTLFVLILAFGSATRASEVHVAKINGTIEGGVAAFVARALQERIRTGG